MACPEVPAKISHICRPVTCDQDSLLKGLRKLDEATEYLMRQADGRTIEAPMLVSTHIDPGEAGRSMDINIRLSLWDLEEHGGARGEKNCQ